MEKDDFEFRPLTEGLGFYSKAERLKQEARKGAEPTERPLPPQPTSLLEDLPLEGGMGPAEKSVRTFTSQIPESIDFTDSSSTSFEPPKIFQPLPRESAAAAAPKRELLKTPELENQVPPSKMRRNQQMEESLRKAFPQTEPMVAKARPEVVTGLGTWVKTPTAIFAAAMDLLTVLVLSFFGVLSLMAIADIDLVQLIQDPRTSLLASLQLGILLIGVSFIYQLATRSLLGHTLGDWAMDVRLGTPQQQSSWTYPLAVLWRHLVFWMTGVVILPFLSLIARRDLAKYLTGLELYRRKMS